MDRSAAIFRRWEQILPVSLAPSLENGPGLGIQEYGSWARLAVAKPELTSDHLVTTEADDLVLATAGEEQ